MNPETTIILAILLGTLLGLIAGAVCWRIAPRCQRCWRRLGSLCQSCSSPGTLVRCPVCGECGSRKCPNAQDGNAADLAESVDQERYEVRSGERLPSGELVRDGLK